MEIVLKSLELKNFKGIKDIKIEFKDAITNIYGDNATGKTSIFDAYTWLLWDKDSQDRSSFDIKPFCENNEVIHGLESKVIGILEIDGEEITLEKIYKEIWTKKRGSNNKVFDGHTTDYFINSVPVKKKDYNQRVEGFITEKEFKLLSNPLYFNEILDMKERRELLLSLIDDVGLEDVLEASPELKKLDLEDYTIDELKAMTKASNKKINEELKEIPARIDELANSKNDYDFKDLESKKKELEEEIEKVEASLFDQSKIAENLQEKNSKINDLLKEKNALIRTVEDEVGKEYREKSRQKEAKIDDLKREVRWLESDIKDSEVLLGAYKDQLKLNEEGLELSREDWVTTNSLKNTESNMCPTCGQEYPPEKQKEIEQQFNVNKSNKLEELTKKGEEHKKQVEEYKDLIVEREGSLVALKEQLEKCLAELSEAEKIVVDESLVEAITYPSRVAEIEEEIKTLEESMDDISAGNLDSLREGKKSLNKELEKIIGKLSLKNQNEEIEGKIKAYEEKERELSKSFEENEHVLYLCDSYTTTYADLVTHKINEMFDEVKFMLFETQINGGIKDSAEALIKGVPYRSANSAARINAGLEVINALSKHIGKSVPVFVDNAESITELKDVDGQIVRLIVSENDKELRIG